MCICNYKQLFPSWFVYSQLLVTPLLVYLTPDSHHISSFASVFKSACLIGKFFSPVVLVISIFMSFTLFRVVAGLEFGFPLCLWIFVFKLFRSSVNLLQILHTCGQGVLNSENVWVCIT